MIDSDRLQTQDPGALSHKEGNLGVCSDMCTYFMCSFFDMDILYKQFEL